MEAEGGVDRGRQPGRGLRPHPQPRLRGAEGPRGFRALEGSSPACFCFYGPFLWNALKELTEFVQILTSHSARHKFDLYSCPYLEKNCAFILFCSLFSSCVPEGRRLSQNRSRTMIKGELGCGVHFCISLSHFPSGASVER